MAPATKQVTIREFEPGDETAFRELNEEWITRYFRMEAKDNESLYDPHSHILAPGGRIFFAVIDGQRVGCCALVPCGDGDFEVAKMAVAETCQGGGIGRKVLAAAVEAASSDSGASSWPASVTSVCAAATPSEMRKPASVASSTVGPFLDLRSVRGAA